MRDESRYLTPVPAPTPQEISEHLATLQRLGSYVAAEYAECSLHGRVILTNVRPWPDLNMSIGECPECGTTLTVE